MTGGLELAGDRGRSDRLRSLCERVQFRQVRGQRVWVLFIEGGREGSPEVVPVGSSSAGHGEGRLADGGLAAHVSCGVHDDVQSRARCGAEAPVANRVDDRDL